MKRSASGADAAQPATIALSQAQQLLATGQPEQAEATLAAALKASPHDERLLMALGVIAAETGRIETAIERFQSSLELNQRSASTLCWLSHCLLLDQQIDSALAFAHRAVALDPRNANAQATLARSLAASGRLAMAISHFQAALATDPNNGTVLLELANVLMTCRLWLQAAETLRRAVLLAPDPESLGKLATLELMLGRIEDAERFGRRWVRKQPDSAEANLLLARVLTEQMKSDEAEPYWKRGAQLETSPGVAALERAIALKGIGRFDESMKELEHAIADAPECGAAYQALVFAKRIGVDDRPMVAQMQAVLSRDSVSANDRLNLLYALGKAHDNLGDYEEAIRYFDEANALKRGVEAIPPFDRAAFRALIDAKIAMFTPKFFGAWRDLGSENDLPILIVGMMRSGTTLAEQMLTCHPLVGGAGEQSYWAEKDGQIANPLAQTLDGKLLRSSARQYLDLLLSVAPGFSHVVDKNPANLQYLGTFHAAFPKARILHIRRNAVDTALSIWMTPINTTAEFVTDRSDIVFAYKQCMRLMDHWQSVLPRDRYREIRYEDLVSDPATHGRAMVEFCGLEWTEACLHPELNERRVRTPSMWQVRQPIYRSSTERWKNYAPWLGAFEELRDLS